MLTKCGFLVVCSWQPQRSATKDCLQRLDFRQKKCMNPVDVFGDTLCEDSRELNEFGQMKQQLFLVLSPSRF